jgi:hypothetical protein
MRTLQTRTLNLLDDAEKAEDGRLRAVAISQVRENVSFLSKLLAALNPAEGDARSLAEQLKRAKAEQLSICIVDRDAMLDGKISPPEALERLVEGGWLSQDVAEEAMRRKREALGEILRGDVQTRLVHGKHPGPLGQRIDRVSTEVLP